MRTGTGWVGEPLRLEWGAAKSTGRATGYGDGCWIDRDAGKWSERALVVGPVLYLHVEAPLSFSVLLVSDK